ncbi:hypothetical protein BDQ12DRAFT_692058 [Crucibulum laeve]|uniref:YMC020W-like alpha/beta hydrolase domain-containing protein n=1 Tax=Crucibulum laeve TaxID=68775 RepID=A0A5C3LLG3_9AGAR|nr:hypothetical protein BDQ12DRAFT_692058 [Crucibulum laeve]
MSSSRRSSHSTRSTAANTFRQPAWRSSSISAAPAPASVSIVFAEPEQGAPLEVSSASTITKVARTRTTSTASVATLRSVVGGTKDDQEVLDVLKERLPAMEPLSETEPVRFTVSDTTAVVGAETGGLASTSATSYTDIDTNTNIPLSSNSPAPGTAEPTIATTSTTAMPFPSAPTNHSNPSLPTIIVENSSSTTNFRTQSTLSTPVRPNASPSTGMQPKSSSSSSTSSWFSSLGRAKKRSKLNKMTSAESLMDEEESLDMQLTQSPTEQRLEDAPSSIPLPIPSSEKEPILQVQPPTSLNPPESSLIDQVEHPAASTSQAITISTSPRKRSWFSSPSTPVGSPSKPGIARSPASSGLPSATAVPTTTELAPTAIPPSLPRSTTTSSLDEEVPPLPGLQITNLPLPLPGNTIGASLLAATSPPADASSSSSQNPSYSPTQSLDGPVNTSPGPSSTPLSPPTSPPTLAGLNPSSSRFMLSLPLLGRPKVPLGSVWGRGVEEGKSEDKPSVLEEVAKLEALHTRFDASPSFPTPALPPTATQAIEPEPTLEAEPPVSTDGSTTSETTASTSNDSTDPEITAAPSSWWGLIGWSAASPSDASPSIISNPTSAPDTTRAHPTSDDSPLSKSTPEAHQAGLQPDDNSQPGSQSSTAGKTTTSAQGKDASKVESRSEDPIASASVSSANTRDVAVVVESGQRDSHDAGPERSASEEQGSWFTPWAWYSSSTTTTAYKGKDEGASGSINGSHIEVAAAETDNGGADRSPAGEAGAVAREEADNESVSTAVKEASEQTAISPPNPAQDVNPIESTISTNRSGWASFFSSRALVVKSLGYGSSNVDVKRDEHGNEVMDLDESDEEDVHAEGKEGAGKESQVQVPRGRDATTKSIVQRKQVSPPPSSNRQGSSDTTKTTAGAGSGSTGDGDGNPSSNGDVAENRKGGRGKQPTAPPLTISDAVRRQTVKSNPANKDSKLIDTSTSSKGSKPASGASTPVPPSSVKNDAHKDKSSRTASPSPSTKNSSAPPPPNLVLPTWQDTFHTPPRNFIPPRPSTSTREQGVLGKTMKFVSGVLFSKDQPSTRKGKERESSILDPVQAINDRWLQFGKELPRAWHVVEEAERTATIGKVGGHQTAGKKVGIQTEAEGEIDGMNDVLKGCRRVVVIGVHGWFPGAMMRTVLGEPTGTSGKFVNMMVQALEEFEATHGVKLEKITKIPLEGEGTIERRVERLYANLQESREWMDDLHAADAIFVATHSQGSVVSTHLLDHLIRDKHIRTEKNSIVARGVEPFPAATGVNIVQAPKPQRVCCLALCGIHLGPLRYLSSSSLLQPYIQYFESTAARELFEFQNTESAVSQAYVKALKHVVDNGTKMVYVASLNDQVVPIYSGLFTAVSHPLILRALYIDGDAYHSSDFLSNLLVLLLRILNTGIPDSGLLAHLSEATAGSLNGVGHSTAYEELATYSLAVKYLFLTNDGLTKDHPELVVEPFNAMHEQNDYEIPWALRDVIADERVSHFFSPEITELRNAFREWHPKTTILRDLKRKLQPIQRLPSSFSSVESTSKL